MPVQLGTPVHFNYSLDVKCVKCGISCGEDRTTEWSHALASLCSYEPHTQVRSAKKKLNACNGNN